MINTPTIHFKETLLRGIPVDLTPVVYLIPQKPAILQRRGQMKRGP